MLCQPCHTDAPKKPEEVTSDPTDYISGGIHYEPYVIWVADRMRVRQHVLKGTCCPMSWPCFVVDGHSHDDSDKPGALWRVEGTNGEDRGWLMRFTNGGTWHVTGPAFYGTPWTITGEPPNITARPSINYIYEGRNSNKQGYRGWLTNGVLNDDLEGRSY